MGADCFPRPFLFFFQLRPLHIFLVVAVSLTISAATELAREDWSVGVLLGLLYKQNYCSKLQLTEI